MLTLQPRNKAAAGRGGEQRTNPENPNGDFVNISADDEHLKHETLTVWVLHNSTLFELSAAQFSPFPHYIPVRGVINHVYLDPLQGVLAVTEEIKPLVRGRISSITSLWPFKWYPSTCYNITKTLFTLRIGYASVSLEHSPSSFTPRAHIAPMCHEVCL